MRMSYIMCVTFLRRTLMLDTQCRIHVTDYAHAYHGININSQKILILAGKF
jgi:hypothetical protein